MHIQTHILSGWCLANCLPLSPRQRLCSMLAATLADLDGLGIVLGQRHYHQFHHTLGHNIFFVAALSAILAAFSPRRPLSFLWYLTLGHVHLLMDYFGSGPFWKIHYLWPASGFFLRWDNAWEFYSWQNLGTFAVLLAWTVTIALRAGRTPLEAIMPRLDAQLVAAVRRFLRPLNGTRN